MTRKTILAIILIAFVIGALGSIVFNRFLIPSLSTVPGLGWLSGLTYNSPIVISRREEVRLNEGVNLIELTKQAQTQAVSIYSPSTQKLLGNGLIITSDGIIFTTKEIVGANQQVTVVTNEGASYGASVRAMDPKSQIAVVTATNARDLQVAQLADAANMQIAQRIFVLGKTNQEFTRGFSSGLVTKTLNNNLDADRVLSTEAFEQTITTDAGLSADYVGGPVVNLQGQVVGMVVSANGQILPAEAIEGAIRTYLEGGKISRPYVGMTYLMVTGNVAKVKGLASSGAQVVALEANSPAAKSGLLANDLILEVNGEKIGAVTLEQFLVAQGASESRLRVQRGSNQVELTLKPEMR
jgi:S1-C subfamily serine protease